MELLSVIFVLGVGPLALLLGADSRQDEPNGWWPAIERRVRAARGAAPAARRRAGQPAPLRSQSISS